MLACASLSVALRLVPFVGLLAAALPSHQQSFQPAALGHLSRRAPALPPFNPDPSPNLPLLSFDASGNFKVAVLTDTHLLDGQNNSQILADQSEAAVKTYLVQEKPNFVVHLGDLISGEAANNTNDVERGVVQILRPMNDAQIPFSTTKGNHDNDVYSTHSSITDLEYKHFPRQSYTRKAPKGVGEASGYGQEGTGTDTYWLGVYGNNKAKRGSRPELLLWFLDSRSGKTLKKYNNTQIEDWIHESVAPYIKSETAGMKRAWKTLPPSLVFTHVPPHSDALTQQDEPYTSYVGGVADETPQNYTTENRRYPGLNDDYGFEGQGGESPYQYAGQDMVALGALLQYVGESRIHGIVSGHQHGNDWCAPSNFRTAKKQNVPVCFAKHSGFGGYDYDNWNHGTRVFQFSLKDKDTSVKTFIRFLTSEVRYQTQLNDAFTKLPKRR